MATHYHADWVVPYWASELDKLVAVGAHIFYRWKGYWGQRRAFNQSYSGELSETATSPDLSPLLDTASPDQRLVVLSAEHGAFSLPSPRLREPAAPALPRIDEGGRLVADETRPELLADEAGSSLQIDRGVPAEH